MKLAQLAYVVVEATDVEQWRRLACDVLGLMGVDGADGTLRLRMDHVAARILVVPADRDGYLASGWATAAEEDFAAARKQLQAAGIDITDATEEELAARQVVSMFAFRDPSGARHEIASGPKADATRFVSPTGVSRFVTDEEGLGHVVLSAAERYDETLTFWRDIAGFRTANSRIFPAPAGPPPQARFLRCNERQHSLALANIAVPSGCAHIGLQVGCLDDVGEALDRAITAGVLARGLGKHVNDAMVSFYVTTPGGFQIEYGFNDGEPVWDKNLFFEDAVGSHWGHRWVEGASPVATSPSPKPA
ncbi:VOC family protein [Streptomyces sp. YKOK-I1]